MNELGYISTICLGLCSIPLLFKTIKDGHCKGISSSFLFLWTVGELAGLIYVIPMKDIPLISNFLFNTIATGILVGYKIRGE